MALPKLLATRSAATESVRIRKDWQPILARCHEHSTLVDAAIGQVVDRLEQLGVLDNTLIIYTADHGGAVASNGGLVDNTASCIICRLPLRME